MKLPNRYGTVVKLSGNRRRPYAVKEGKTGQQKIIGYAETKEEALKMLADYNHSPWNINVRNITFSELYTLWLEKKSAELTINTLRTFTNAYKNHCRLLYDMPYNEIRSYHMKDCMDNCNLSASSKNKIKGLFHHLDMFAMELDIINKPYSDLLKSEEEVSKEKIPFTHKEIALLWEHKDDFGVDTILFLMYTGYRISEMLDMKIENVDLDKGVMYGGNKTAAGKNKIVPIHSKIRYIVEKHFHESQSGYLFEKDGEKMYTTRYRYFFWDPVMKELEMEHTPHDCRHTLRSNLDTVNANKASIDRIMGHASQSIGERVYTHKTIEQLKETIELLPY